MSKFRRQNLIYIRMTTLGPSSVQYGSATAVDIPNFTRVVDTRLRTILPRMLAVKPRYDGMYIY